MSYFREALDPSRRKLIIDRLVVALSPIADSFDAIAWRGLSGGSIAPVVAHFLNKHTIAVRKGENSHSRAKFETSNHLYTFGLSKYVIVDDFVRSGETVRSIIEAVVTQWGGIPLPAIYCYGDDQYMEEYRSVYVGNEVINVNYV